MSDTNNSLEEKIKLLQLSFINELPGRLNDIDVSVAELDSNPADTSALEALTLKLHSLAGTSATFGLPQVTELAREGEKLLKIKKVIEQGIDSPTTNRIKEILFALHNIISENTIDNIANPVNLI